MGFSVGQIVQCYRVNDPRDSKLIGAVGEIRQAFDITEQLLTVVSFGQVFHYVVYFPMYAEGNCPYCEQYHNPLLWMMCHNELRPLQDPDAGEALPRAFELEEVQ